MKLKARVWVNDEGDLLLRLRNANEGVDIELKIGKGDYITRNDVIPNDSIMGIPPTDLFNELKWILEAEGGKK